MCKVVHTCEFQNINFFVFAVVNRVNVEVLFLTFKFKYLQNVRW